MMITTKLRGLVAAAYTPLDPQGGLHLATVAPLVDHLIEAGIDGLYVCGSTGEGMSLSTSERKQVLEAYVQATRGRVPVVAQVGHNSLADSQDLARHARVVGATAISATCPSYFKVNDEATLVACMSQIASEAPELPFYYYHIPVLTGSTIDMVRFLGQACEIIPNLVGLKYTDTRLHEFQECVELERGRFDVVWGCDEMLLGAVATGASGAIGSTYNIAPGLYRRLLIAFSEGDFERARQMQSLSIRLVRTLSRYPFHPAMKAVLAMMGFEVGPCRLPMRHVSSAEAERLRGDLEAIGFFEWQHHGSHPKRQA